MSEESTSCNATLHEKIAVFSIGGTHIWSGQRSNTECDFTLGKNGKLPPKEARASLGAKYLVNPATLSPFYRAKDAMVTLLQETGVHYLGGYAVALEKAKEIESKLDQCVRSFEAAKASFLTDYGKHISEWAARPEFVGYGDRILQEAPSLEYVEKALTCGYSVFRVMPLADEENIATDEGLSDVLFSEVRASAKALYRDSFEGKSEVTRRVFGAIHRIAEKLRSLSFLDSHALPLSTEVTRRLSQFGKHGPYKGTEFTELANIVLMLTLEISPNDRKAEEKTEVVEAVKATEPTEVTEVTGVTEVKEVKGTVTQETAMPDSVFVPDVQGTKEESMPGSLDFESESESKSEPELDFALEPTPHNEDIDLFRDLDAFVQSENEAQELNPLPETVQASIPVLASATASGTGEAPETTLAAVSPMPQSNPSRTLCVAGLVL